MRTIVACRILTHEAGRTALATLGVFSAVVLVFMQLGFFSSVPIGATFIYEALDFDIALTSRDYTFQVRPGSIPRQRLGQATSLPDVESAYPFYQRFGRWLDARESRQREIFVMAFNPEQAVFRTPSLRDQASKLKQTFAVLIDDQTGPEFGQRTAGAIFELNRRKIDIAGEYRLGTGFLGRGAVAIGDHTFGRLFTDQTLDDVHVGLVKLRQGADPQKVAVQLRNLLPDDTRVLTRADFNDRERHYWLTATSTGLVFGFGTAVAAIVGATILFQTLSTLILRNLKEFAVLKAMGFENAYITQIVATQAMLISLIAFLPAIAATYGLYDLARSATNLSIYMTGSRMFWVFAATMATSISGALLTLQIIKRADPADLF